MYRPRPLLRFESVYEDYRAARGLEAKCAMSPYVRVDHTSDRPKSIPLKELLSSDDLLRWRPSINLPEHAAKMFASFRNEARLFASYGLNLPIDSPDHAYLLPLLAQFVAMRSSGIVLIMPQGRNLPNGLVRDIERLQRQYDIPIRIEFENDLPKPI